jgi:hypothetical protein
MTRLCDRPGCSEPASATLDYNYAQRSAWLTDLTPERHPARYDLCDRHADGLCVPLGWALHVERRDEPPVFDEACAS